MENKRVCDLVNRQSRTWRQDLVTTWFQPDEAASILSIPLSHVGREDRLVWSPSKTGEYTTRSGYHRLMEVVIDNLDLRVEGEWNRLWRAKVPHKFKLLVWRGLRNVLPTRRNLRRKGVDCPVVCPHCEVIDENAWHAFYGCPKAIECWRAGGLWDTMQSLVMRAECFNEATFELLVLLSGEQLCDFFMLFWCIWRRRNDKVWKGEELAAGDAVMLAREFTSSWRTVRSKDQDTGWHISNDVDLIWRKPAVGRQKCNADAALFTTEGKFGIDVCVRDYQGAFVVAKTMWFPGSPTPKEAEAIALLEAVKCVKEEGLTSMSFEIDFKAVADDISTLQPLNNELGTILDSCRELLQSLQNYEVSFIRRQANFVAHSLARASRLYASSQLFNSIPSCITGLLLNEMK